MGRMLPVAPWRIAASAKFGRMREPYEELASPSFDFRLLVACSVCRFLHEDGEFRAGGGGASRGRGSTRHGGSRYGAPRGFLRCPRLEARGGHERFRASPYEHGAKPAPRAGKFELSDQRMGG